MFETLWRIDLFRTESELKDGQRDLLVDGYFRYTEDEAQEKLMKGEEMLIALDAVDDNKEPDAR